MTRGEMEKAARPVIELMDGMTSIEVQEFLGLLCQDYCRKCGRDRSDYKCRCWDNVETW